MPVRLGKVLRAVRETEPPYVLVEPWEPVKGKYERINVFGTWAPPGSRAAAEGSKQKRARQDAISVRTFFASDILVWPLVLDQKEKEGQETSDQGGKIPLSALHYMRESTDKDVSAKRLPSTNRSSGAAPSTCVTQTQTEKSAAANFALRSLMETQSCMSIIDRNCHRSAA